MRTSIFALASLSALPLSALSESALPLSALSLSAFTLIACEPPPAPPPLPPQPAVAPAPPAPQPFSSAAWGTFHSARFEMRLPLPEGKAWRIDDHTTPWLTATHAASGSALVARTWSEEGRVNQRRCEERARLWRALPDPARADVVSARSIDAPAGFDTFVTIGVIPGKPGEALSGFAIAFGGRAHRCFAWAYTTSARGALAEQILGERLATMVERSLGRVIYESDLTPRIPREPISPARSP